MSEYWLSYDFITPDNTSRIVAFSNPSPTMVKKAPFEYRRVQKVRFQNSGFYGNTCANIEAEKVIKPSFNILI